ncbi:MAG TPA: hypothetical protein DCZ12_17205, partial [Gammaproteobacteria bacterium]|nr:hypothetical protein [Gammaproteobacteria bacterium]
MTDFQSQLNNFYQTSLGRDAGAEGKSYWQGQYDSGMGLDEIQKRIADSKEAKGILSTTATMADMPTKAQVNDSRSQVYNGVSLNEDNSNFNQWYAEKVKSGQGYYGPSGQAIMDAATASGDPARIAAAQKLKQGQHGTGHGWAINGGDAPEMPPEGQQLTGAKAYGYDPTGYKAAARAKAHGYAAPGAADTTGYDPVMQSMTDEQRSAYQLAQITSQDSPYMRQARLSGLQQANQR